jgi:hypothetical protein
MPLSGRAPRDPEWELLLLLSSYPLRELDAKSKVVDSASGCIISYRAQRTVLTVAHVTGNQGRWAIELRHEAGVGTKLYEIGTMNLLARMDPGTGSVRPVDLAYAAAPNDLQATYALYQARTLVREEPRVGLATDLSASPEHGRRYGFSGQVKVDRVDVVQELQADVELETGLIYEGEENFYDIYSLDHPHPGDASYKGCSGAPILSPDGDLVGLVCGRGTGETVRALPLRRYRVAFDVMIDAMNAATGARKFSCAESRLRV